MPLRCGLVEHGFARLWSGTCRTNVLCPFSCRGRSFCPSCEKKKQLLWAEWLQKEVLTTVPHRHVVLTMPRLLRGVSYRMLTPEDDEMQKIADMGLEARILERRLDVKGLVDREFIPTDIEAAQIEAPPASE